MYIVLEGFEIPHPSNHFRSERKIDQCLLSQKHTPAALVEQYQGTSTPSLHMFTGLWEDGRNALHMYSNPEFFFQHWRTNMQKPVLRRRTTANLLSVSSAIQNSCLAVKPSVFPKGCPLFCRVIVVFDVVVFC